ncbi:translesion DNA synthesis-associated protein ImuA [Saccharospirillum mangrovi]|uniref:translesion DNA synthesis-associated protein ImuA n=1 Tax=Saccharospirillum mangrovi TaxID=2161747 RepID=UPI000D36D531|nr:translesion DNA synthesis-associated protein ImuA [Saccharospirillum mangrovi]
MSLLTTLTERGDLWSGQHWRQTQIPTLPTGQAALDAILPGGGWPSAAVTELFYPASGQGELRVLLPALAQLSQSDSRWQIWCNAPFRPHGSALAHWGLRLDRLLLCQTSSEAELCWTLEQSLSTGGSHAVVAWVDVLDSRRLRRLQLAAEKSDVPLFLLRPTARQHQASMAALRLAIEPDQAEQVRCRVLKRRGGWPGAEARLSLPLNRARPGSSL